MSFYDASADDVGFVIDRESTSDVIARFHRTLMDRRQEVDWSFDPTGYDEQYVATAGYQWAQRAVAEYQSTAQFAQLLHRLTLLGAPIELIGAATRLATDECRHAELCAHLAEVFGADQIPVNDGLSIFDDAPLAVACARTILTVCCFGETLSVPILRALSVVATDPLAERIATIIAADEEYHARFGWEALPYFIERHDGVRAAVAAELPYLLGHFERVCHGGPEVFERLQGTEFTVTEGEPNLGTLPSDGYAAIFYATVEDTLFERFESLEFDVRGAWERRLVT